MGRPPKNGWSKDRKYFNGKPIEHWKKMADKSVVDHLIRGVFQYADKNSYPRELASQKLMELAFQVDRFLVAEVLEEKQAWQSGAAMALASFLLPPKHWQKSAKRKSRKR